MSKVDHTSNVGVKKATKRQKTIFNLQQGNPKVDHTSNVAVKKAAKRQKTIFNLQQGNPLATSKVAKATKNAKRRARRKGQMSVTKDDKERRFISAISHKKAARSCNWQSFNASKTTDCKTLNETSTKSVLDDLKKTGFQKALARRKRKAELDPNFEHTPETIGLEPIVPSISADSNTLPETSIHNRRGTKLTNPIAIDCEMVGVNDGRENMLARVSLVNTYGDCIYDKFVFPKEKVVDYRTFVSGVRPADLAKGENFEVVIKEVGEMLKGRILVGHAVHNDLKVLHLPHPKKNIRDTATYPKFKQICGGHMAGLKKLAAAVLGIKIQQGEHDSVIDARATMQLYMMYSKEWEEGRKWRSKKTVQDQE